MFPVSLLSLVLLCVAGLFATPANAQRRYFDPGAVYDVPVGSAPTRGPADALVTIVEFSDFRCGYCRKARAMMAELDDRYPGQLRLVYKHFTVIDPNGESMRAAEAAEAAHAQGQFWAMHDRLFTHAGPLTDAALDGFARDLGLDMARFRADMDRERRPLRDRVLAEAALAERLGLGGTPAFFVNGRPIEGAQPVDVFVRAIADELARAKALVASGVAPSAVYDALIAEGVREGSLEPPTNARRELDPNAVYPVTLGAGLSRGRDDALVTLVVFDDFECPYCGRLAPTLDELRAGYGDRLRIVFRHNPLPFHQHAMAAHEAAMEAAAQGKFWAMYEQLFAHQRALERADLERYARAIGLDLARFRAALDDGRHRAAIEADQAEAKALGARGTPTVFVNGTPVAGAQPVEVFRMLIEAKASQAETLLASGVPRRELYARAVGLPRQPVAIAEIDRHIEILTACRAGDGAAAAAAYARLPKGARRQSVRRDCAHYGVELP
jgi:protein-disulfide isomerase